MCIRVKKLGSKIMVCITKHRECGGKIKSTDNSVALSVRAANLGEKVGGMDEWPSLRERPPNQIYQFYEIFGFPFSCGFRGPR